MESINLSVGEPFKFEFGASTRDLDFDVWGLESDLSLSKTALQGQTHQLCHRCDFRIFKGSLQDCDAKEWCQSIHYYVNYCQFERLENPVAGGYKYLMEASGHENSKLFKTMEVCLVTRDGRSAHTEVTMKPKLLLCQYKYFLKCQYCWKNFHITAILNINNRDS